MKKFGIPTLFIALLFLVACNPNRRTGSEDWPQYKNDNYRSGVSSTLIDLHSFEQQWVYQADHEPIPAWYGPAYEDAFANSGPLPSMRDYDLAYYPIIVGDRIYYGSSSDDALHCLDDKTGEELWRYTTNGPIRIAPVYQDGNLYFGSDDGYVYSLKASTGKLNWKYCPSDPFHPKVLNNSRLISFWPIRTGVLLEEGKLYFGASLLPWKPSYFCAIDQKSGQDNGIGCYKQVFDGRTLEGAMVSTGTTLIQPQGRIAPAFFDKETGDSKGSLPGSGGCFVLVTPEEHIIHPQNSRKKSLHELAKGEEPDFMSFDGGKELVVKGDTSYVLTDHSLSAYERSTQKLIWLRRNIHAQRIILAGDYLFAGTTDTVLALSTRNGLPLWKFTVQGTVFALAAAHGSLYAATGEGYIYKFKTGSGENELFAQNNAIEPGIDPDLESVKQQSNFEKLTLVAGPFIEPIATDRVKISFQTAEPMVCYLNWMSDELQVDQKRSFVATHHSFQVPVRKGFRYSGTIQNDNGQEQHFEYDNFFNFVRTNIQLPFFYPPGSKDQAMIDQLLTSSKIGYGLCIILGTSETVVPLALLDQTNHFIIQLTKTQNQRKELREKIIKSGLYGQFWSAYSLKDMPIESIRPDLASAIWLESIHNFTPDQIINLLAPEGRAIIKSEGKLKNWIEHSSLLWQVDYQMYGPYLVLTKKTIENQGEWTHQYARPDNSAFGGESLWGSTSTEEFEVQWMGRPGPRFQTDRSGRKPAPLSTSGKLFVQGKERVLAQDVYNGAIYWSKHFPGFIRMNIHRDCSNWASDEDHLFMAIKNNIVKVNHQSGVIDQLYLVGNSASDATGYVSVIQDFIIGSVSPAGSHYTDYHGGAGWYDWASGPMAEKVISTELFKKSKANGEDVWRYHPVGVILNTTITQYNNRIYFVESRTAALQLSPQNRAQDDVFNEIYLIALEIETGAIVYEKRLHHHPGKTAYAMAAGSGKLAVLSSGDGNYHLYVHDCQDGDLIWDDVIPWFNGDHGGHLSRPAIVGNKLVIKPTIYNLDTGIPFDYNVPKSGHGCASYALTEQSIFYRGGSVTQFNFDTREFSRWERLRPDCWISSIPAQGMILSPEAGGGCSCGNWLETSMVMAPLSRAPITIERAGSSHLMDFKDETYGNYHQEYLPNHFPESMEIEINIKQGTQATVYYTLDGSEPTEESTVYKNPLSISESKEVKTLTVEQSSGGTKKFYRQKRFTKIEPN